MGGDAKVGRDASVGPDACKRLCLPVVYDTECAWSLGFRYVPPDRHVTSLTEETPDGWDDAHIMAVAVPVQSGINKVHVIIRNRLITD